MNAKYLYIGGIALLAIFSFGIGLYMFTSQGQQEKTLGVQEANQIASNTTNQAKNQKQENYNIGGENKITNIQPEEFKTAIDSGKYTLIDIRTADEYASGHIKGATQSDFYQTQEFNKYLDSLDKNQEYLIYCRSGNRSGQALNIMKNKGFTEVSDLAGGISAWTAAGLPIE